ncbi:Xaa-His dipeptidase [Clostridiaceae bacterium JG1575]|nr:Xaa-His dipeptidase [Clostridiaceae bacterium JG1575]
MMDLNERIDSYREEMIQALRRILAHPSVAEEPVPGAPCGPAVAACLEDFLSLGRAMGFHAENLEGWVGELTYGSAEDYVAVLGHLDIVPVGSGWVHDPFAGEIEDGKMYGRGTNDDKGPLLAALFALKAIKESHLKTGSSIRIIAGTCEETGGPDIETYLRHRKQPRAGFTPDANFPAINAEKGILNVRLQKKIGDESFTILHLEGGNAPNMVPDAARAVFLQNGEEKTLQTKGISAHGSTPEKGENAILSLFRQLEDQGEPWREMMNPLIAAFEDVHGTGLGLGLSDEPSGKLSANLGQMSYEEGILSLIVNLRVPVTFGLEEVEAPLRKTFEPKGFTVTLGEFTPPLYYPKDLPMIETLMKVYRQHTGEERAQPLAIGGGTYAKTMENVVAFGPSLPGRPDVDHIADEYIHLSDFMLWTKIYAQAMLELSAL